jgi:hypothetical protein
MLLARCGAVMTLCTGLLFTPGTVSGAVADISVGTVSSGSEAVTLSVSKDADGRLCLRASRRDSQRRGDISCTSGDGQQTLRASTAVLDCKVSVAYGTVGGRARRVAVRWDRHLQRHARLFQLPRPFAHTAPRAFVAIRVGHQPAESVTAYTLGGHRLSRETLAPTDSSESCG